ncbi:hypothetical protein JRI60_38235 [Archangium violaceum]|uniref:hypothetical protein n=1 Tax=Archangium violaceum TaxID=83451 RepID=UPI0019529826|nr:hypothetical protein [Archangium violaceum]QRN94902.1 hypothetical protein JRI60_38235 [Archangium violaceum]
MNVERLTAKRVWCVLAALVVLAGSRMSQAAGLESGERYEVLSPGQPPVLVYRPETAAVLPVGTEPPSTSGSIPATIDIVYPTRGQSGFGSCWMDLDIDSAGNLYPINAMGVYRILPDGTLVNGVGDVNLFTTGSVSGVGTLSAFVLDESRNRFFGLEVGGVYEAPFTEGSSFSLLVPGNGTSYHELTLGRGPLADSLLANVNGTSRVDRVTLSPPGLEVFSDSGLIVVPGSMASAPDGTVYVVSTSNPTILPQLIRIGTDGTASVFAEGTDLQVNGTVAVDAQGNVYWSRADGMAKYAPSGQLLGLLPGPPDKAAFGSPRGAVFDAHGDLFLMDNFDCKKIYKYTLGPQVLQAVIDISPGDATNELNPRGHGRLKVALLSSDTLDATQVALETIRFGATGTEARQVRSWWADVNGDGRLDTVLVFKLQDTQLSCASTSAVLTGHISNGVAFQGADAVVPTGCSGE